MIIVTNVDTNIQHNQNLTKKIVSRYLAGDDDNDDGDDKDDDEGDSFNQKRDDDADDFFEGYFLLRAF